MPPRILDLDAGVLPARPFCSRRKCSSLSFGRKLQLSLDPLERRHVKALLVLEPETALSTEPSRLQILSEVFLMY